MTSKNVFAKFDQFKNEVEELLQKVKELQSDLKDSLQEDKSKKILLKNIDQIQSSINDFKEQFKNKLDHNIQEIINKAKSGSVESTEELEQLHATINKFINNSNSNKH